MAERPSDLSLRRYHGARLDARQMDELIGLARGLTADGVINLAEAEFLRTWLEASADLVDNPVVAPLLERLRQMLADGVLDKDEAAELLETLRGFSGADMELGEPFKSTTLPLDKPLPSVNFTGNHFCFTGTFQYGKRMECEGATSNLGGICGSLTKKTNYLVIGIYATESWMHSCFGNKIERAVEMKQQGLPIFIIAEDLWRAHLPNFGAR